MNTCASMHRKNVQVFSVSLYLSSHFIFCSLRPIRSVIMIHLGCSGGDNMLDNRKGQILAQTQILVYVLYSSEFVNILNSGLK